MYRADWEEIFRERSDISSLPYPQLGKLQVSMARDIHGMRDSAHMVDARRSLRMAAPPGACSSVPRALVPTVAFRSDYSEHVARGR